MACNHVWKSSSSFLQAILKHCPFTIIYVQVPCVQLLSCSHLLQDHVQIFIHIALILNASFFCLLISFPPLALLLPPPPPYYTEGYSLAYEATNQLHSFTREKQAGKRWQQISSWHQRVCSSLLLFWPCLVFLEISPPPCYPTGR